MTSEKIIMIKEGCPLCRGDVAGNNEVLFLCRRCYVRFRLKHIMDKGGLWDDFTFGR
ncbi:hypothetical protein GF351_05930 [Candidatus Woesearchaeota archaeon]|nr:hypothetical protein [Candidatus Woesearchaeota archaeon]